MAHIIFLDRGDLADRVSEWYLVSWTILGDFPKERLQVSILLQFWFSRSLWGPRIYFYDVLWVIQGLWSSQFETGVPTLPWAFLYYSDAQPSLYTRIAWGDLKKINFHLQELISVRLGRAQAFPFSKKVSQMILKHREDRNHCSAPTLDTCTSCGVQGTSWSPSLDCELPEAIFICHHRSYILRLIGLAPGTWLCEGISLHPVWLDVLAMAFLFWLGSCFCLWLLCCLFFGPVYFWAAGILCFLPSWSIGWQWGGGFLSPPCLHHPLNPTLVLEDENMQAEEMSWWRWTPGAAFTCSTSSDLAQAPLLSILGPRAAEGPEHWVMGTSVF